MNWCTSSTLVLAVLALPFRTAQAQIVPELVTQSVTTEHGLNGQHLTTETDVRTSDDGEIAQTAPSTSALTLSPRWRINAATGAELVNSSAFGEVHGFLPFAQSPGRGTFFFEGQMRLFTEDSSLGGNAMVGYRRLLEARDLVLGGYVGADFLRTEDRNSFGQFGLGAEVTAKNWEARVNGYLPLSEEQEVGVTGLTFQGNQLFINLVEEVPLSGVDLEGGYRLINWREGSLYSYVGPYFLRSESTGSFVGIRGRLEAVFSDRYHADLTVSSDSNFGTNVVFQLGATFGKRPSPGPDQTVTTSAVARLAQPLQRQDTIVIDRQATTTLAINPATGQAYRFIHVTDGAVGGNGTVETPFSEVTEAIGVVATNEVIYVDAGDRSGFNGFTIPDNVQVLASGVDQTLTLSGVGALTLPGTGTLPLVNGAAGGTIIGQPTMVVMGENTTLSGFEVVDNATSVAIGAEDKSGYTITQNRVSGSGVFGGIVVTSNTGTVSDITVSNNSVTSSNGQGGIVVFALGGALSDVMVVDNTVSTTSANTAGINVFNSTNVSLIDDITLSGNTVTTSNTGAVAINTTNQVAGATITDIHILNNTLTTATSSSEGLFVTGNGATTCLARFTGNTLVNDAASTDSDFSGTVDFVGLSRIATDNPGFDDNNTGAATVNEAASC